MFVVNRRRSGVDCKRILCESKMSPCCFFTAYTYCIRSYALQTEYEPGATNLFQHPRQCYKELYDQCMAKKKKNPGHGIYFLFFCLMSVLETLQLFDKALIGFLLEIHFKFTLNAFMTVKHVCVCQNHDSNRNRKIDQRYRDFFFCPYRTALVSMLYCSHWIPWKKKKDLLRSDQIPLNIAIPCTLTWTLHLAALHCHSSINLLLFALTSVSLVYRLTEDQTLTEDRRWSPAIPWRRIFSRSSSALFEPLSLRSLILHLPLPVPWPFLLSTRVRQLNVAFFCSNSLSL